MVEAKAQCGGGNRRGRFGKRLGRRGVEVRPSWCISQAIEMLSDPPFLGASSRPGPQW